MPPPLTPGPRRLDPRDLAFGGALVLLAVYAAFDHVQWALACTAPIARGDGPRHALYAVSWARHELAAPSFLGLAVLGDRTYYPGLTTWLALPFLESTPTGATFRAVLGLFSGVMAAGTGLLFALAWRVPDLGSSRLRVNRNQARIPQGVVAMSPAGLVPRLLRPPNTMTLLGWPPDESRIPLSEAVEAIEAHRSGLPADPIGTLLSSDPEIEAAGMLLAIEEHGLQRLRAVGPWTREDVAALRAEGGPIYVVELLGARRVQASRDAQPFSGGSELVRLPGRLPPPRGPVTLVVRALPGQ